MWLIAASVWHDVARLRKSHVDPNPNCNCVHITLARERGHPRDYPHHWDN